MSLPPALIFDANILVYLSKLGLLPYVRLLVPNPITSDFVSHEMKLPNWSEIKEEGIRAIPLDKNLIAELEATRTRVLSRDRRNNVSVPDISLIVLSKMSHTMLLTEDKNLKKAANEEGCVVGSLRWLLDCMGECDVFPAEKMVEIFREAGKLLNRSYGRCIAKYQGKAERGVSEPEMAYVRGKSVIVEENWNE